LVFFAAFSVAAPKMVSARKKNAPDVFRDRLRVSALSPTAARVARFIDQHRATANASSAAKLAARTGTSDATVVRTVQALGFEGLPELKEALVAGLEQRSTPADHMKKTLAEVGEDSSRSIDNVFDTHRRAPDELGSAEVKARITTAISRLHWAERIVVFGIGSSAAGALRDDLAQPQWPQGACPRHDGEIAGGSAARSERTRCPARPFLRAALSRGDRDFSEAHALQLPVILVTDTLDRRLAQRADVVVPARRCKAGRVALHGATFVVLEAIVLGLAASDRERSLRTLQRLNSLREIVDGTNATRG
jgi:DNA-binding MurR/RpiR family transcriptional regulator